MASGTLAGVFINLPEELWILIFREVEEVDIACLALVDHTAKDLLGSICQNFRRTIASNLQREELLRRLDRDNLKDRVCSTCVAFHPRRSFTGDNKCGERFVRLTGPGWAEFPRTLPWRAIQAWMKFAISCQPDKPYIPTGMPTDWKTMTSDGRFYTHQLQAQVERPTVWPHSGTALDQRLLLKVTSQIDLCNYSRNDDLVGYTLCHHFLKEGQDTAGSTRLRRACRCALWHFARGYLAPYIHVGSRCTQCSDDIACTFCSSRYRVRVSAIPGNTRTTDVRLEVHRYIDLGPLDWCMSPEQFAGRSEHSDYIDDSIEHALSIARQRSNLDRHDLPAIQTSFEARKQSASEGTFKGLTRDILRYLKGSVR